jgi:FixJ family two-component response regulator
MPSGHVLVVEDDDLLRDSLENVLMFEGYAVQAWHNANRFLQELPRQSPAVVITDMRMPGMTGLEMHRAMQAAGRVLPVIYISGESTLQELIDSMKMQPVDFLLKPFGREALLAAVAKGLDKDRLAMQQQGEREGLNRAMSGLTQREREVCGRLVKGCNNAEIMAQLGLSLPTVKQYKSEVMRKLGVQSLSQLIALHATNPGAE